ncbi:iron chelate uptake ABC transporter family permease subunit [Bacillus licheniformis]|nr:iron chelate uptake ABC transporter family permease subunit [Bacillus licheniformis]
MAERKSVGKRLAGCIASFIWCCLVIPPIWLAANRSISSNQGTGLPSASASGLKEQGFCCLPVRFADSCCCDRCGNDRFIGLMAPHIARKLAGAETKILIPVAALVGGIVL